MICKNCLGPIGYTGGRYENDIRRNVILVAAAGDRYIRYLCSGCIDRGYKIDTRTMKVAQR